MSFSPSENLSTTSILLSISGKLLLLSTLSYGLVFSVKNYNSQMHQASLNKHRATALDTFKLLYDATVDQNVRDGIVVQMCKAIFEPGVTGYIAGKDGGSDLEFVKILQTIQNKS